MTTAKRIQNGHLVVLARAFFSKVESGTSRDFFDYVKSEGYTSSLTSCAGMINALMRNREVERNMAFIRSSKRFTYSATPLLGKVPPRVGKNTPPPPTPEGVLMLQNIFMSMSVKSTLTPTLSQRERG